MAKLSRIKIQPAVRFFGSQSPRLKALRKGQIAGQLSTIGCRLLRCVSISQMKQILRAPWRFQIPPPRRFLGNAVEHDALPLPLPLNLHPLPEDRSRGSGRGRLSRGRNARSFTPRAASTLSATQAMNLLLAPAV